MRLLRRELPMSPPKVPPISGGSSRDVRVSSARSANRSQFPGREASIPSLQPKEPWATPPLQGANSAPRPHRKSVARERRLLLTLFARGAKITMSSSGANAVIEPFVFLKPLDKKLAPPLSLVRARARTPRPSQAAIAFASSKARLPLRPAANTPD